MYKKLPLTIALGWVLAGCSVGSEYQKPETPLPDKGAFMTRSDLFDPAIQLDEQWWQLYHDPALNRLVEQALAANNDLQVAEANLLKARGVLSEVQTRRLPSTTVNGGVTYGDSSQSNGSPAGRLEDDQWSESAGLTMAWEVDLFGRVRQAIQAATANEQAVAAARDVVRVTVVSETSRAYLNACSYAYALDVAEDSLRSSEQQRQLVAAQARAGTVVRSDVERAEGITEAARANVMALRAQHRAALFELTALLGVTPSEIPASAQQCRQPPEPIAALPVGDAKSLLRRRPDLRQAERTLAADAARVNVAVADLYPSISIGGSINYLHNDVVSGSNSVSYFLGPLISWHFPNMKATRARIKQAKAQVQVSYAQFQGQIINALTEVEKSLSNVANEQARYRSLARSMSHYENAYELENARFKAGTVAYLNVLQAQQDMYEARSRYAQSVQRLASYRIDLFKSLGGGWQDAAQTQDETRTAPMQKAAAD